jgi:hypothetical protein
MIAPAMNDILAILDWGSKALVIVIFLVLAVIAFLKRNWARVGGKIGRRSDAAPLPPLPDGFSRVECREIVNYGAPADGERYPNLKTYMRDAAVRRPGLIHIYHVAGSDTRIEIPAATPHYDRIDAAQALALLRELPDPRLVLRLHLSDAPSFLDPWSRKAAGRGDVFHLGIATNLRLVVLYLPDRAFGALIGTVLMHEWVHLLGYKCEWSVWRFKRANAIEELPPLEIEPTLFRGWRAAIHEPWADLGEKLLGYDEALAREAALAAPVHAMILWRCVEKTLRKTPKRLASTRLAEFQARAAFMRQEVAPKARAARASRRWWRRLRSKATP